MTTRTRAEGDWPVQTQDSQRTVGVSPTKARLVACLFDCICGSHVTMLGVLRLVQD
jgi:hypothetical protein